LSPDSRLRENAAFDFRDANPNEKQKELDMKKIILFGLVGIVASASAHAGLFDGLLGKKKEPATLSEACDKNEISKICPEVALGTKTAVECLTENISSLSDKCADFVKKHAIKKVGDATVAVTETTDEAKAKVESAKADAQAKKDSAEAGVKAKADSVKAKVDAAKAEPKAKIDAAHTRVKAKSEKAKAHAKAKTDGVKATGKEITDAAKQTGDSLKGMF
jgi:hypothetical protein